MNDKLMTTSEVAEVLRVKPKFVYKLIREEKLRCYRVGQSRNIRVSTEQLQAYLEGTQHGQN